MVNLLTIIIHLEALASPINAMTLTFLSLTLTFTDLHDFDKA